MVIISGRESVRERQPSELDKSSRNHRTDSQESILKVEITPRRLYSQRGSLNPLKDSKKVDERKEVCERVDEEPELASRKIFIKRKEINIPLSISVPQILD